jgi:hypothetical protein
MTTTKHVKQLIEHRKADNIILAGMNLTQYDINE